MTAADPREERDIVQEATGALIDAWLARQGIEATVEEHCQAFAKHLESTDLLATPKRLAEQRATALEERARWIRDGSRENYPRDELADWLDASARRHRQIGGDR